MLKFSLYPLLESPSKNNLTVYSACHLYNVVTYLSRSLSTPTTTVLYKFWFWSRKRLFALFRMLAYFPAVLLTLFGALSIFIDPTRTLREVLCLFMKSFSFQILFVSTSDFVFKVVNHFGC